MVLSSVLCAPTPTRDQGITEPSQWPQGLRFLHSRRILETDWVLSSQALQLASFSPETSTSQDISEFHANYALDPLLVGREL